MSSYVKLDGGDLPAFFKARAGIRIEDWAGDWFRVSDGGDGSIFVEMANGDVSVYPDVVKALRDYLTEVLEIGGHA